MTIRRRFLLFFSTFMMPIPYLGAATPLGMLYSLGMKFRFSKAQIIVLLGSVSLVVLTFLANYLNSVSLSYEEMKRLAVIVCAAMSSIFFYAMLAPESSSLRYQNHVLLYLGLGQLVATKIFWQLPTTLQYQNYSWFKFAGANALILVAIQLFMISGKKDSNLWWITLGIGLSSYAISQSAKSIAFITLFIFMLRYSICRNPIEAVRIKEQLSDRKYKIFGILVLNFFALVIIRWLIGAGFLGSKLSNVVNQYGGGLISSLSNARPEFGYSMKILRQQPFSGFGTISNPLDKLYVQIDTSEILSFQEQRFLIFRILGGGFNLHSWSFDLVARAGFLCFIPVFVYFIYLLKCLFSIQMIKDYPGLIYMVIVSTVDLFFSPYSWFVSSQIAYTYVAIYLYLNIIARNRSQYFDKSTN